MTVIQQKDSSDVALGMARQSLYRFAALSLLDPRAGCWDRLDALRDDGILPASASFIRSLPEANPKELGLGERPLADLDPLRVLARLPGSRHELNKEYENTFGLLVSNACPPYETEYINSKFTFQRSNAMADVSGFYRAFGLTMSDTHPERPDHIVQELEFMAFLIGLERQAEAGDVTVCRERQQVCREAQRRFLREHLSWWAPAFAKLLSRESRGGFYDSVSVFLAALVPAERGLLAVEASQQHAEPSSLEHPEACDGCQLAN